MVLAVDPDLPQLHPDGKAYAIAQPVATIMMVGA